MKWFLIVMSTLLAVFSVIAFANHLGGEYNFVFLGTTFVGVYAFVTVVFDPYG
jgi:hypothetical protein